MQCIVRVAPLRPMPAETSVFDYLWPTPDAPPAIGSVITIPFRRSDIYAVVLSMHTESAFTLKTVAEQTPLELLVPDEVAWLERIAPQLGINIGTCARNMLPPLTKRTTRELKREVVASPAIEKPFFKYAWYQDRESRNGALRQAVEAGVFDNGSCAVICPTRDRAEAITKILIQVSRAQIFHFTSDSAPERRRMWNAWCDTSQQCVVIGTHLPVWLPHRPAMTWIVDEPTHPFHAQFESAKQSSNIDILASRRRILQESAVFIAHSPATADLDRIEGVPDLAAWPVRIDRTIEHPSTRALFLSPTLETAIADSRNILFFVPHLQQATHAVCRDCGELYATHESGTPASCKTCQGTSFNELGYGAKTLIKELQDAKLVALEDHIDMIDATAARTISPLRTDTPSIVIATGPLYDRIDMSAYDCIIDLTADFDLLHPVWSSEERLWHRLRAMSSSLRRGWSGKWYVQTRKPHLLAWSVQNAAGYTAWRAQELPLRKRFGQPPFI